MAFVTGVLWLLCLELGAACFGELASELPLHLAVLGHGVYVCAYAVHVQNCLCGHVRKQILWHMLLEPHRCFLLCSAPSIP